MSYTYNWLKLKSGQKNCMDRINSNSADDPNKVINNNDSQGSAMATVTYNTSEVL